MGRFGRWLGGAAMLSLAVTAGVAQGAPIRSAVNILPTGQSGDALNPHFTDQLELYKKWQFKPMPLDPPAGSKSISPKTGVKIFRDTWGVPYIVASTDVDTAFGAGYAEAEDRFLQMDILRHQVEGRLAELIPPSQVTPEQQQGLVDGDAAARANDTTDADLLAQLRGRPNLERQMYVAFANGINAWLKKKKAAKELPAVEYLVLGAPAPWKVSDSLHIAYYIARNFGLSGGRELREAALLRTLRAKFTKTQGNNYFEDITWRFDSTAPTTISLDDRKFTYATGGDGGLGALGVAVPDGAVTSEAPTHPGNGPYQIGIRHLASNAIAVAKSKSLNGHNLLMGGPQVGQYLPAIVVEIAMKGRSIHSRGMTFPGIGPSVLIGRTRDHAWTFTSGIDDQSDTWAELVNPANSNQYRFKGAWESFANRTEKIIKRTDTGTAVAKTLRLRFAGHLHGLVVGTGKVGGRKVAFTNGYTFRGNELRILGPIMALNREVSYYRIRRTLPDFVAGFNMVYADTTRIAYWHLGWYPVRAKATDDRLPTWGTGLYEWLGRIPFSQMPAITNPKQGWIANWNNKPIDGWYNGDSTPWGTQTRVTMLIDQLKDAQRITTTKLRRVIRTGGYLDARLKAFGPIMLDAADQSSDQVVQDAADALASWDGFRIDRDNDGKYDSAGPAIIDRWWQTIQVALLRGQIGRASFDLAGEGLFDEEFWGSDRSSLLLHVLKGSASSVALKGAWPSGKNLNTILAKSFADTVASLRTDFASDDVNTWLAPRRNFDYTSFSTFYPKIADTPAMNRGSYNQIIELG